MSVDIRTVVLTELEAVKPGERRKWPGGGGGVDPPVQGESEAQQGRPLKTVSVEEFC